MPKDNGKLIQTEYDSSFLAADALQECCYCLTRGQVRALIPTAEYLAWEKRWYSESNADIDAEALRDMSDDLVRRLMMSCGESTVRLSRINADTGLTEISTDGGLSWSPNPEDPRIAGIALPPPIPAGVSADKCAAAGSGATAFYDFVQEVISQKTAEATLVEFLLAIATLLVGLLVSPLWALFPAAITQIMQLVFGYELSAFTAAMTTEAYQAFQCLLYCKMGDDGSFDQAGYDAVLAGVGALPNAISQETATAFLKGLSLLGLNNACATGVGSVWDCDECDCEAFHLYIAYEFGEIVSHETGSNTWRLRSHAGSGRSDLYFRFSNENLSGDPNNAACYNVNPITLVEDGLGSISLNEWECGQSALGLGDFVSYENGDCHCQITVSRTSTATVFEVDVTLNEC